MRWPVLVSTLVIVFAVSAAFVWSLLEVYDQDPHAAMLTDDGCILCHKVSEDGRLIDDEFKLPILDPCYSCHPHEELGRSHPVNVDLKRNPNYPDMVVPDELVVGWDWDDLLTCATCHRVHMNWKSTEKAYPGQKPIEHLGDSPYWYSTFYLRIPGDPKLGWAVLCDACHRGYL